MSPSGLPAFEAAGGAGSGTGGGLLAQNGAPAPFGGTPLRGRAGVEVSGTPGQTGPQGLAGLDEDDVPQDGRVPVIPRSYFDEKDEKAEASAAAAGRAGRPADAMGSAGGASETGAGSRSGGGQGASGAAGGAQGTGPSGAGAGASGVQASNGAGDGAGEERAVKTPAGRSDSRPLRIEVPFEMTVVCNRDGVIIHPGGYRLSPGSLKAKGDLLIKELNAVLQRRREVDPLIVPRPRLKFLIASGGAGTYEIARRQTSLAGLAWPTTIQIGDTSVITFSGLEGRR